MSKEFTPRLLVDLAALQSNFSAINACAGTNVAAVVKANAYGLGVVEVARSLWETGCRTFFCAFLGEGLKLRRILPDAEIFVMSPAPIGDFEDYLSNGLKPCLYSLRQARELFSLTKAKNVEPGVGLHLESGMNRVGLSMSNVDEFLALLADSGTTLDLVMSHFACADDPAAAMNQQQYQRFREVRRRFPDVRHSLSNSGGAFLQELDQMDLVRAGLALYGCDPHGDGRVLPVASLQLPVLQIKNLHAGESVGYGATAVAEHNMRVAVLAGGYADGVNRLLGERQRGRYYQASVAGQRVSLFGRVSMDMTTVDVTAVDEQDLSVGDYVELYGVHCPIEEFASFCNSIPYEVLTSTGDRVRRIYRS